MLLPFEIGLKGDHFDNLTSVLILWHITGKIDTFRTDFYDFSGQNGVS